MPHWNIYHGEREHAHELGDPLITTVEAGTKQDAERLAEQQLGYSGLPSGAWAIEQKQDQFQREMHAQIGKGSYDSSAFEEDFFGYGMES